MRVIWNIDRKILVDENEMTEKGCNETNAQDQESQERPAQRSSGFRQRLPPRWRLTDKQQFIGKVHDNSIIYSPWIILYGPYYMIYIKKPIIELFKSNNNPNCIRDNSLHNDCMYCWYSNEIRSKSNIQ